MPLTVADVREALKDVKDPEINKPLLELNMIDDIEVHGDDISLTVFLTTPACPLKDQIEREVKEALSVLEFQGEVKIKMDHRTMGGEAQDLAPGVKNFIAVASGKGGVGKSTVAVNLAMALKNEGAKVGLLDADVFGPSVPHMLSVSGSQPVIENDRITPVERDGLKVMSIGFFVGSDESIVWRGPMLHKTLSQFLGQVEWGDIDYLIIDLPPGTGDIQLSLVQLIPLTGAVIVSTPQDIALLDVYKCADMFLKTKVHLFGMIENMSVFQCAQCGHEEDLFGEEGALKAADKYNIPVLGKLPLRKSIRLGGDSGQPAFNTDESSREDFTNIARSLASAVSVFRLSGNKPEKIQVG